MSITINGTTGIAGVDGTAAAPSVQGADSNTGVFFPATDTVAITTGGSERMRVDSSGNVGIGTSSPDGKIDIQMSSMDVVAGLGGNYPMWTYRNGSGSWFHAGKSPSADAFVITAGATPVTTEFMRVDSSGTISAGSGTTNINYNIGGQIQMPAATTETRSIEIGGGRTGNGYAHIDFIGDATYTDFGLRIIRNNTGANANSEITHRGTGGLILTAFDNSFIYLQTNNTVRFVVGSAGQLGIGGATYGTSGQVLTSGGSGAAPSWSAAPAPTTAQVGAATAALAVGDVGSYAWLTYQTASGAVAVGTTFAGANLRYHGVVVVNADAAGACGVWGGAPSGTWRCMGSNGANGGRFPTNIYLRIS